MLYGAVALVLAGMLGGCATTTQEVQKRRYFFPRLPERPRFEWLNAYMDDSAFKKKGGLGSFLANVVGEDLGIALDSPLDIKVAPDGRVFVTDTSLPGVVIFDMKNQQVRLLGGDKGQQMFVRPTNIALDDSSNLYVLDVDRKLISVYDSAERPVREIVYANTMKGGGALVWDRQRKRLLCADTRGDAIYFLSSEGKLIGSFGKSGDQDGEFNRPSSIAVDSKGEIIVADAFNARIQIFDGDGKFLRKFGVRGDNPGEFQQIKAVAVDSEDHVYVTDGKGNKVEVFSTAGDYLLTVGARGSVLETGRSVPYGFLIPQGITVDANDIIYVVDSMNKRFQVIQYLSDDFIKKNPIPGFELK
jgi:DNA-binding beta-propeller fold protein YncE